MVKIKKVILGQLFWGLFWENRWHLFYEIKKRCRTHLFWNTQNPGARQVHHFHTFFSLNRWHLFWHLFSETNLSENNLRPKLWFLTKISIIDQKCQFLTKIFNSIEILYRSLDPSKNLLKTFVDKFSKKI